ncbi:MAG: hypothetical protein ACRDKS_00265 [Actinomycetota bacterium]
MEKGKARVRRALAALALTGLLVPAMAGSAGAASPALIVCTAAGTVTFVNGAVDSFSVSGRGSCQGDFGGTYFLDFAGSGGSDTLGLCDQTLVVQNLNINVLGTLTNAQTLVPKFINHDWFAPLTTYPLATPFLVAQNGGGVIGAGNFFNHIFLQCNGPTVAQFAFAFLV